MKIEKSSSNYLILDSGTAMTFDNQATLQLKLVLDQSFYFTVQILFKKGDGGERELMQSVDTETNTISLSCKNFDNALGTGTNRPIELATYQNKNISTFLGLCLRRKLYKKNRLLFLSRKVGGYNG